MDKANTIFTLEGVDVIIPCSTKDKMGTICQRYTTKIEKNINSLVFLYGGNQLNFQLSFEEQTNSLDKQRKNMNILVYKNVDYSFISKSEENINLIKDKIDDIIKSINNIKDNITGVKSIVENIIKKSTINSLNTQLKKMYLILNNITKDIEKNNERLKDLLNDNHNIINLNYRNNQDNYNNNLINIENSNEYDYGQQILNHDNFSKKDYYNSKYSNYPERIVELINNIRQYPSAFADIIEESIHNIIEYNNKDDNSKNKIVYNQKIKVCLSRGEPAFHEAAEELRNTSPLPPLEFVSNLCIPLPETEEEMKDPNFFFSQVTNLRNEGVLIDIFFKDLVKVPEVSALLMIVDDISKNAGKKRMTLLNKELKFIGVNSKFIGKTFIAYLAFSK